MACAKPLRAYAPANGGRVVFWKSTQKEYWVEPYTGLTIPCGHCILCRSEQARQTAVRITHEATLWQANSFVTLTYGDTHLPAHGSLNYEDLVKFWKRLRKKVGSLRYYAVGEYGDKTLRPHYHACLFGHDFTKGSILIKGEPHKLWTSPMLNEIWGLGNVTIGQLNFQTARYTASYVTKKLRSKQRYVRVDEESGELVAVTQPRAFMSRNIAKGWWIKWGHHLKNHDTVIINGQEHKPPKAYDRWLGEQSEQELGKIKEYRVKNAKHETTAETHARTLIAHARVNSKSKTV